MSQEQNNKIQRLALQLNKTGLSYLSNQQNPSNAFQYFKKAQKLLQAQDQIENDKQNIKRLLAVTYNNLAIYYKRTNKPKAALTYLKNALQIQTFVLEDWLATASTHLNICAIYSFMNKHQQAVDHANLSIENAQKAKTKSDKNQKDPNYIKSCGNVELAGLYNLAVQYQHLKKYQDAITNYSRSKQMARLLNRKNIQTNSQESISRLQSELTKGRKKIIELLQKRKQTQEKGNYQSMRRNKKNYRPLHEDQVITNKTQKYNIYNDQKKRTQSVSKIVSLRPLRSQSTQGLKRKVEETDKKPNQKIMVKQAGNK